MDIEKLAVSAIEDVMSRTDYIAPYVNSGDREPCWDGNLYVYSDVSKKNEHYKGKVLVQVKGKRCEEFSNGEFKYPIRVTDLKNYSIEGGTIYFVVQIKDDGEKKIYYNPLLPYELNRILKDVGKKNTVSISMYEFPMEKDEITNVIFNFIRDKDSQVLLRNGADISIESFIEQFGVDKISYTFSYTGLGYDRSKPYQYLFNHDVYLYAECKELNIKVPIDHLWRAEICKMRMDGEVRIGDIVFYNEYDVAHKVDADEIHIGKCFELVMNHDGKTSMRYTLQGNLFERIRAEKMMVELIRENVLFLNGVRLELSPSEEEMKSFNLEKMESHLKHLQEVKETLEFFGVTIPLECSNLTDKDEERIRILISARRGVKAFRFIESNIPPLAHITIGNLKILLYFKPNVDGSYYIGNYLECEIEVKGQFVDGNKFDTSKFTTLEEKDFISISNLNVRAVVDELISINNRGHNEKVNITLLELIKAYDNVKKEVMLEEAIRLASWLYDVEKTDIALINLFQCYLRKRGLTEEEEEQVVRIVASNQEDTLIKAGAYILLRNTKRVETLLNELPQDVRDIFMKYPIYSLLEQDNL